MSDHISRNPVLDDEVSCKKRDTRNDGQRLNNAELVS